MSSDDDAAPGLKVRLNADGSQRFYWTARSDLVRQGYKPATVRLHHDPDLPGGRALLVAACRRLQAEMLEWAAGNRRDRRPYDGTIKALVREYQRDPASPYAEIKWNTRRTYDDVLDKIERAFGKRTLVSLKAADFRRWYDEVKKPKKAGAPERLRKAHGVMSTLRRLMSYGIMAELSECGRLQAILEEMRFKGPPRRRIRMELDQAMAVIAAAVKAGRLSIALGTALQFEAGLRQRDVIGEWEPLLPGEPRTGIVLGKRRWVNGLLWSDIDSDLRLRKQTTKTGAIVAADLRLMPLVMEIVALIPAGKRIGPMILDETAGRPYAEFAYGRDWRSFADAAGVPRAVWNMDARAGAITEAEDAGAELDTIRGAVGHTQASTTARYSRGALGKSRKVAELRAAFRKTKNKE